MSYGSRGGRPATMRLTVGPQGLAYSLPFQSAELILRPQDGEARLYWHRRDWEADPQGTSDTADNYMALNSSAYPGGIRLRVAIDTLYLRGNAVVEATIIGQG